MLSPLKNRNSQQKLLDENDLPQIKSDFIRTYGYDLWKEIPLNEFFELLPEMHKYIGKQESLRIATLKYYGVKNPK